MDMLLDILKDSLPVIITAVLLPTAVFVGKMVAKLIRSLIAKIDNEKLQGLAYVAVRFVEQKFQDLHGQDKLDKAYEAVANKVPGLEKADIERFIEAAVKELNLELKNE